MNNTILNVSVGIAAYNAELNIKLLLNSLIHQKQLGYKLNAILLHADKGTDNTVGEAMKIKDTRIKIIDPKERKGFAGSVKRIIELSKDKSDVTLILNDDIVIKDNQFVQKIVNCFKVNENIGLVSSKIEPFSPQNFVESSAISGFNVYKKMASKYKNGSNAFSCDGKVLALSNSFIRKIEFPKDLGKMGNVDSFLYLSCLLTGFKYMLCKESTAFFRMPATLKDFIKWQTRNTQNIYNLRNSFKGVDEIYKPPFIMFNSYRLLEFIKNPIGSIFIYFTGIYIYIKTKKLDSQFTSTWDVINTTKTIKSI